GGGDHGVDGRAVGGEGLAEGGGVRVGERVELGLQRRLDVVGGIGPVQENGGAGGLGAGEIGRQGRVELVGCGGEPVGAGLLQLGVAGEHLGDRALRGRAPAVVGVL